MIHVWLPPRFLVPPFLPPLLFWINGAALAGLMAFTGVPHSLGMAVLTVALLLWGIGPQYLLMRMALHVSQALRQYLVLAAQIALLAGAAYLFYDAFFVRRTPDSVWAYGYVPLYEYGAVLVVRTILSLLGLR